MGIDFSVTLIAMNCLYFVIELLFARDMVGIGTVVNWFLVGPIASFFEKLFLAAWGQPQGFPQKLLLLGAGVLILSFSCALYQTADVGISPYDSLSLLLARKLPIQYFWCRIFTDAVCVGAAFLLGGLIRLEPWFAPLPWGPLWHSLPGARRSTWSMARRLLCPAGRNGLNIFKKRLPSLARCRAGALLLSAELFFNFVQGAFFQPGDLGLGNANHPCHLHLGLAL